MTQVRQQSQGMCRDCGYVGAKASMTRHQAECVRRGLLGAESTEKSSHDAYRLRVSGQYRPEYWLDAEVPLSATLDDLDGFLRGIWLECCGHMSAFTIGPQADYSRFSGPDTSAQPPLSELGLKIGQKFGYTYDFGSSTDLTVEVQARERVWGKAKGSVRLLARNLPPEWHCSACSARAKWVHSWEHDEQTGGPLLYCGRHGRSTREEQLPVVNSPRMGECGYEGGNLDNWPPSPKETQGEPPAKSKPKKASRGGAPTSVPLPMNIMPVRVGRDQDLGELMQMLSADHPPELLSEPEEPDFGLSDIDVADLLPEVSELPLRPEAAWLVAAEPLPGVLPESEGVPVLVLVIDMSSGQVLRGEPVLDAGPDDILKVTLLAMFDPGFSEAGGPDEPGYRPAQLLTPDPALAFSLHTALAGLGIRTEHHDRPEFRELLAEMRTQLGQALQQQAQASAPRPFLDGAPDAEVAELIRAFGRFVEAEPWAVFEPDKPLLARWVNPDGSAGQLYATVMGDLGEVQGLSLYPDWLNFVAALSNPTDPALLLGVTGGVESLTLSARSEFDPADWARLRANGLPDYAEAGPALLRFGPAGTESPSTPLTPLVAVLDLLAQRAERRASPVTSLKATQGGVRVQFPANMRGDLTDEERQGSVRLSLQADRSYLYGGEIVLVGPPEMALRRVMSLAPNQINPLMSARQAAGQSCGPVMLPYHLESPDVALESPGMDGEPLRATLWEGRAGLAPDLTLAHLARLGHAIESVHRIMVQASVQPEVVRELRVELP
jgi:hypothetical protein